MSRKGRYREVKCPNCHCSVRLNNKGLIRSHSVNTTSMFVHSFRQCLGTYKKPTKEE